MKNKLTLVQFYAWPNRLRILLLIALFSNLHAPSGNAQAFRGLGWLEPEQGITESPKTSRVLAMSGDGSVVVGHSIYGFTLDGGNPNSTQAFRWTQLDGMNSLGLLPGRDWSVGSIATGVSFDGLSVVGTQHIPNSPDFSQPFLWSANDGWGSGLGTIAGHSSSYPFALSGNGRVTVGQSFLAPGTGQREAFRWTAETGMTGLGFLPGNTQTVSVAHATSNNGDVIVGVSSSDLGNQAFRWTEESGMVGLGDLPGGFFSSSAFGTSIDGTYVVGNSRSELGFEAFLWSATDGMQGLGDLPGETFQSRANAVSQNGEVVVGWGRSDLGQEAFIWRKDQGMFSIRDLLINAGVAMSDWTLTEAVAVSADGRWIAGNGFNSVTGYEQGWIVDMRAVPEPSSLYLLLVATAGLNLRIRRR